ncbi:unnamed protein product, partial [Prorocentrum cordatum]
GALPHERRRGPGRAYPPRGDRGPGGGDAMQAGAGMPCKRGSVTALELAGYAPAVRGVHLADGAAAPLGRPRGARGGAPGRSPARGARAARAGGPGGPGAARAPAGAPEAQQGAGGRARVEAEALGRGAAGRLRVRRGRVPRAG